MKLPFRLPRDVILPDEAKRYLELIPVNLIGDVMTEQESLIAKHHIKLFFKVDLHVDSTWLASRNPDLNKFVDYDNAYKVRSGILLYNHGPEITSMSSIYLRYKTKFSLMINSIPEYNILFKAIPEDKTDKYLIYVVTKLISKNEIEAQKVINIKKPPYFDQEVKVFKVTRDAKYYKTWVMLPENKEYGLNFGRWYV